MRLYIAARRPSTANGLKEWLVLGIYADVEAAMAACTTGDDVVGTVRLGEPTGWSPALAQIAPAKVTWEVVRVHRRLGTARVLTSGLARADALAAAAQEKDDEDTVVIVRPAQAATTS